MSDLLDWLVFAGVFLIFAHLTVHVLLGFAGVSW